MTTSQDSEAISAYLTDLQNQLRPSSSPSLASAVRVLSEPLSFLGLLSIQSIGNEYSHHGTNDTTQSKSDITNLPKWAGLIESATSTQLYFIQHLLPNHLDFILDNITLDWFYALSSAQQTSLFDAYFVPRLSPTIQHQRRQQQQHTSIKNQFEWETLMAVVSLQTLVSRINIRFQDNHSFLNKTILRLLSKLLECYSLQDFFQGSCNSVRQIGEVALLSTVSTAEASVIISTWDSFLTKLFSIPTRVFNTLGGNSGSRPISSSSSRKSGIEECFQDSVFFKRQAIQLHSCLENLVKEPDVAVQSGSSESSLKVMYAKGYAAVIAKFLRLGYGKILVETMISEIWDKQNMETKCLGWKIVLRQLAITSSSTASQFLATLVEHFNRNELNFNHSQQHHRGEVSKDKQLAASKDQELQLAKIHRAAKILVAIGFGTTDDGRDSDTKGDGFNNNALVEHVLFQGRVYDIGVLRMLICVQSGWPSNAQTGKDSVLTMTFKRALEIWSDSMLVNHASADYQRYVSYQILLMTGYFGEKDAIDSDLISIFYKGMPYWLELENPQRRQLGMVIAEEISLVVDPTGKPADFELEETDNIRFARSLVLLKDGCKPYNPEALISTDSSNGLDEGDLGENVDSQDSKVDEMHESDDEEDPDAIVDQFSRATLHDDSDSDSDDDVADDDDVKPYAMEYESDPDEDVGASNKPKVAAPLYLRDLLSYLRASEDREKFEVGLQNAAELIRRKVGSLELEEHAEQLTAAMAVLGDYFDTKNFYKMRENTLVALVVTSPVIASGVLTLEFYEKKNSVGQRLNILTALVLGAREISGFDRSPSTNASSSSASAQSSSGQLSRSKHATSSSVYSTSSALSSTSTLVGPTSSHPPPPPATFDNITSNISLAKTRRFSQKSNIEASRPAPKANAFSNVAPVFLGGLLGRWGGNRGAGMERGYDALQKAPVMVMKKFVITLGVLVYFAGNSPHLISITRELFRFLFALRYHNPPSQPSPGNVTPGQPMTTGSGFVNPTLTSLKLPGEIEISTGMSSRSDNSTSTLAPRILNTLPYNPEMLESILYDLLILLTPSPGAMSDQLLMDEFFVEVMECHAWTIELWGMFKMEEESDNKARMYCAALVQRCHELLEVK